MERPEDVVLLLPGFFGFSRLSGLYYFAERAAAALRGGLDARERGTIPVVPLSTLPAASLRARQGMLLAQLRALCARLGGLPRLHLVGHSAGGIDGYLLTCARPVGDAAWRPEDDRVRRAIASVVTVASPFHGTWLTEAAAAQFALDPRHSIAGLAPALRLGAELVRQRGNDALVRTGLVNALAALPDAGRLCWRLLRHRRLIADLAPDRMAALLAASRRELPAPVTHFVTVVPRDRLPRAAPFFADLYALTEGRRDGAMSPAVAAAIELLNRRAAETVRPPGCAPPVFDPCVNDGIVNSARQIADPDDAATLGGIVLADHADVLGYYDNLDALVLGPPLNESVFRSGAGFSDDAFYELYRRIAERIATAIQTTQRDPYAAPLRDVS